MPVFFVFLLKINIALLIFCAGYYFVLRRLTFYGLNRIYLVTAILFASIYPQINLSGFLQQHQQIAGRMQAVAFNWQTPARALAKPLANTDYWYWGEVVFWTGAALLALRLLIQLYSLYKLYRDSKPSRIYEHEVRIIDGDSGPFSFWKSIYVNPANHEPADLRSILLHEQVHVNEWHTLDILLAELSTAFYWFNPGIWLMKKAVRENIEFITDSKILSKGIDSKSYQYSLLSVSLVASSNTLVSHFNISTIKKRVIMMNAKRSSKVTLTRYAFLVPAVIALLLVFSISKAALNKKTGYTLKSFANKFYAGKTQAGKSKPAYKNNGTVNNTNIHYVTKPFNIAVADTIKSGGIVISGNIRSDSTRYFINGVKATKADFRAMDPDHIYSLDLVSAETANTLLNETGNTHNVMFITTDDSAAGKKFKEKIDNLNNNTYTLSGVSIEPGDSLTSRAVIVGKNTGGISVTGKPVTITQVAPLPYKIKQFSGQSWKHSDSMYFKGGKVKPFISFDSVYVIGKGKKNAPGAYVLTTGKNKNSFAYFNKYSNVYTPKASAAYKLSWSNENSAASLSNKLIFIDGKEASEKELKKLSVADIKSIRINNGEEATEDFNDKGKNGVVYIITKKAKK